AYFEYASIARALGAAVLPGSGVGVLLTCLAAAFSAALVPVVLLMALIVVCAASLAADGPGPRVLMSASASIFPIVYIGLPLGTLAATRIEGGRNDVLLLLAVLVVSDSAQYYTGRAVGRRRLAPTISPKKTVEGAIGGVVFAAAATIAAGRFVLPLPFWILGLLGAAIALLGIAGDLFESLLKRSAGLKDSSDLIPGHGGVLDRIDSWLFAAPVYYLFVRLFASLSI
ncbi:MAG TPA: phosphatidate cytidylyltransferase, partial [Vicinamibacterales bacterium]